MPALVSVGCGRRARAMPESPRATAAEAKGAAGGAAAAHNACQP